MRVMIDSNILDRLDADTEARNELVNRRDILLLVTPAQEREVIAIPDLAKRDRLLGIIKHLCRRLALHSPALSIPVAHEVSADNTIISAAVATGCDLLVSEDIEVLNKALAAGIRAMDWRLFLGRVVWVPQKRRK